MTETTVITVTPIGLQRRILALMWIGYDEHRIARAAGVSPRAVAKGRAGEYVNPEARLRLACAWQRLQCRPIPPNRNSMAAHKTSVIAGGHSPLAWKENEIDFYHSEPHGLTRGRDRSPWATHRKDTAK